MRLATAPDDPEFVNQNQFSTPNPDADIHLTEAWDLVTDARTVTIAVIDSGVKTDHEDLVDNLWSNEQEQTGTAGVDDDGNGYIDDVWGWNTVDDNNMIGDTLGHGTNVTGMIGAYGNNGTGMAGVCWRSRIMVVRAFEDNETSTSRILDAIDYILEFPEVRIVNASWGDSEFNLALQSAVQTLTDQGVLFVCAAGNDAADLDDVPFYPASLDFDGMISVAAVTDAGGLTGFSNRGSMVSVAAPGSGVLSTSAGGGYAFVSGTSFATPIVSGASALLLARNPTLTAGQIKQRAIATSRMTAPLTGEDLLGGLIDVHAFLDLLIVNSVAGSDWTVYR